MSEPSSKQSVQTPEDVLAKLRTTENSKRIIHLCHRTQILLPILYVIPAIILGYLIVVFVTFGGLALSSQERSDTPPGRAAYWWIYGFPSLLGVLYIVPGLICCPMAIYLVGRVAAFDYSPDEIEKVLTWIKRCANFSLLGVIPGGNLCDEIRKLLPIYRREYVAVFSSYQSSQSEREGLSTKNSSAENESLDADAVIKNAERCVKATTFTKKASSLLSFAFCFGCISIIACNYLVDSCIESERCYYYDISIVPLQMPPLLFFFVAAIVQVRRANEAGGQFDSHLRRKMIVVTFVVVAAILISIFMGMH